MGVNNSLKWQCVRKKGDGNRDANHATSHCVCVCAMQIKTSTRTFNSFLMDLIRFRIIPTCKPAEPPGNMRSKSIHQTIGSQTLSGNCNRFESILWSLMLRPNQHTHTQRLTDSAANNNIIVGNHLLVVSVSLWKWVDEWVCACM